MCMEFHCQVENSIVSGSVYFISPVPCKMQTVTCFPFLSTAGMHILMNKYLRTSLIISLEKISRNRMSVQNFKLLYCYFPERMYQFML